MSDNRRSDTTGTAPASNTTVNVAATAAAADAPAKIAARSRRAAAKRACNPET